MACDELPPLHPDQLSALTRSSLTAKVATLQSPWQPMGTARLGPRVKLQRDKNKRGTFELKRLLKQIGAAIAAMKQPPRGGT